MNINFENDQTFYIEYGGLNVVTERIAGNARVVALVIRSDIAKYQLRRVLRFFELNSRFVIVVDINAILIPFVKHWFCSRDRVTQNPNE